MSVLGFETEWFDPVSGLMQIIYLKFFLDDNTIELLSGKNIFLKRIYYPQVQIADLFVGNTLSVYNRLLVIKKFANTATEEYMRAREVRFVCTVSRKNLSASSVIFNIVKDQKFALGRVYTTSSSTFIDDLDISYGDTIIEVVGISVANKNDFLSAVNNIGPSTKAILSSESKITELLKSCKGIDVPDNCTLCLIKPHVVKKQLSGEVIKAISEEGFTVSGLFSVHLTLSFAEEVFDAYRNVFVKYNAILEQMTLSPTLAVLITGSNYDLVERFRDFVGPVSPQLAKVVRPNSLRALFGEDEVKNGIHSTDLSEDAQMECKYFFNTLANL